MATTTPAQGLPVPEDPDVPNIPADLLALATAVERKLVQVYQNAADRDSKQTSPAEGMVCMLKDSDVIQFHNGTAWVQVFPFVVPAITSGPSVPANSSGTNGDLFVKTAS